MSTLKSMSNEQLRGHISIQRGLARLSRRNGKPDLAAKQTHAADRAQIELDTRMLWARRHDMFRR